MAGFFDSVLGIAGSFAGAIFGATSIQSTPTLGPMAHNEMPHLGQLWPKYLSSGLSGQRLASILRSADLGYCSELMTLLQEVAAKDPLIRGMFESRQSSLVQRQLLCVPNPNDYDVTRAKIVAEYGNEILKGLNVWRKDGDQYKRERGLAGVVECMDSYWWYGFSEGYLHWEVMPGTDWPRPVGYEAIDHRRFSIDPKDDSLILLTDDNAITGIPIRQLGQAHLIELRNSRLSVPLAQAGIGRACSYPWWLRFNSWKNLVFVEELVSVPSPYVELGPIATFNQDIVAQIRDYIRKYVGGTGVVLPPGAKAGFFKTPDGVEKLFAFIDSMTEAALMYAILGQTGTASGQGGSLAKAQVNAETREDIIRGDASAIEGALQQILTLATVYRFGYSVPAPSVKFISDDTALRNVRMEYLAKGSALGAPVTLKRVMQEGGFEEPEDNERLIDGSRWSRALQARVDEVGNIITRQPSSAPIWIGSKLGGQGSGAVVPHTQNDRGNGRKKGLLVELIEKFSEKVIDLIDREEKPENEEIVIPSFSADLNGLHKE